MKEFVSAMGAGYGCILNVTKFTYKHISFYKKAHSPGTA